MDRLGAVSDSAERLCSVQVAGLSRGAFDPGASLEAEVGYGLDAYRRVLTPYGGLSVS